jgi:hypothetical protein
MDATAHPVSTRLTLVSPPQPSPPRPSAPHPPPAAATSRWPSPEGSLTETINEIAVRLWTDPVHRESCSPFNPRPTDFSPNTARLVCRQRSTLFSTDRPAKSRSTAIGREEGTPPSSLGPAKACGFEVVEGSHV